MEASEGWELCEAKFLIIELKLQLGNYVSIRCIDYVRTLKHMMAYKNTRSDTCSRVIFCNLSGERSLFNFKHNDYWS